MWKTQFFLLYEHKLIFNARSDKDLNLPSKGRKLPPPLARITNAVKCAALYNVPMLVSPKTTPIPTT